MPDDYIGSGSGSGCGSGIGSGSGSSSGTGNAATITDVGAGECIPLTRQVTVSYSNGTSGSATLSLSCDGASVTPASAPAVGTGTGTFTVAHSSSGTGHTLSSALTQGGVLLAGGAVSVNVGNPCPLSVVGVKTAAGLTELDPTADLSGTFDATRGNHIVLLAEEPAKIVGGIVRQPLPTFADPATVSVDGKKGTWNHPAIPGAKKGQYLRIVLTKDGKVRAIIRAVFK